MWFLELWISQGICLVVILLGHMADLFLGFFFFFLRKLPSVLHNSYIILHSCQQYKRVPFSTHPFQYLLFVEFFFLRWPFWLVRSNTSLKLWFVFVFVSDVEHLFMYLLAIFMSSLEKCLLVLLPIFLLACLLFRQWASCMTCLYICEINTLSVASFAIMFSHSEGCLYILFIIFLYCANASKFI